MPNKSYKFVLSDFNVKEVWVVVFSVLRKDRFVVFVEFYKFQRDGQPKQEYYPLCNNIRWVSISRVSVDMFKG